MSIPIPNDIKECVVFVLIKEKDQFIPIGTAFFVGVKKENNKNITFFYLVTAKHVLLNDRGEYYSSVFIRLNKISGDADIVELGYFCPSPPNGR